MASIEKRVAGDGSASWRVIWREGATKRHSPAIATPDGAVELKRLVETVGGDAALRTLQTRSGRDVDGTPLLRDYLDTHLALLDGSATPGTVAKYRRDAERSWLPALGSIPLDRLTRADIEHWLAWQRRQTTRLGGVWSTKSIANVHGLLSSVLRRATEDPDLPTVQANPAYRVRMPRDQTEHEVEVFDDTERAAFLAAIDDVWRPLTAFLLASGCRFGEATALRGRDVALGDGSATVRVRRAWKQGPGGEPGASRYEGSPKSSRGTRSLSFGPAVTSLLADQCVGRDRDDLVFPGRDGSSRVTIQTYRRAFDLALGKAEITKPLTPKSLRHTCASLLLRSQLPLIVVQRWMGHESITTTERVYGHLVVGDREAAGAVVDSTVA